ncbi:hypothetical protein GCM10010201_18840 [Pilimelia columellifera subsp. columellifera]|uniref:Methyl-accepting chemotaxis protein n=1 Tax=Pilimelia columellifera subsp. columellifera TaxID=706583 RepID=A0ABP6AR43_9ACTN
MAEAAGGGEEIARTMAGPSQAAARELAEMSEQLVSLVGRFRH